MDEQAGCVGAIIGLIIGLVIMIFTGGSFRTEVTFTPQSVSELAVQTSFKEDFTARHWVGGLIKGQQPDLQGYLAKYLGPGKQISRIKIVTRHSVTDLLLMGITLLIYCPQTVTVEGTINQAPEVTAK
jgi:hypothetical protein